MSIRWVWAHTMTESSRVRSRALYRLKERTLKVAMPTCGSGEAPAWAHEKVQRNGTWWDCYVEDIQVAVRECARVLSR